MTTTTPNMSLVLPDLNGSPGVYDTYLNAALTLLDLHDHSTGYGVKVKPTGIDINASLTFANNLATNVKGISFYVQGSAPATYTAYVQGVDLYYKDGNSNVIRLTASGAVNMTTTGGFAGDYVSAAAAAYYDSATKTYRFLQAAPPNSWARVASAGVDLYEIGLGITTRVRLSSPAGLGASYEWTWPASLPASNALVQVSATGTLTTSNTVTKAVTMSEVTTFLAGATADANQHFTVSGTGRYKHGSLVKNVSAQAGNGTSFNFASGYIVSGGAATWWISVPFNEGERLQSYSFRVYGDGAADMTYEINTYSTSAAKTTLATATLNNTAAAWTTEAAGSVHTFAAGSVLVLEFSANAANYRIGNISLTYDRP